jgi:hypothetical protein
LNIGRGEGAHAGEGTEGGGLYGGIRVAQREPRPRAIGSMTSGDHLAAAQCGAAGGGRFHGRIIRHRSEYV